MVLHLNSTGLSGISGYLVEVECCIASGLPGFDIVGLPDAAVKESRERVRAAITSTGFKFPTTRITMNLAPAGTKKSGTLYDLPILLGILAAAGQLRLPGDSWAFLGELSMSGELRAVSGVLPMVLSAKKAGIDTFVVPEENGAEATLAGRRYGVCTEECGAALRPPYRDPPHGAGHTVDAGSRAWKSSWILRMSRGRKM